jgi:hypothetical protein
VGRRYPGHAQDGGQRAGGDPDLRGIALELVGHVAGGQVEEESQRPVDHPQQHVHELGEQGRVLVVAGVESLPEHEHRSVGEVGALVEAPDERQPVIDVHQSQCEPPCQDEQQQQALWRDGSERAHVRAD